MIERLREYCAQDRVFATNHAADRFRQRGLARKNYSRGVERRGHGKPDNHGVYPRRGQVERRFKS